MSDIKLRGQREIELSAENATLKARVEAQADEIVVLKGSLDAQECLKPAYLEELERAKARVQRLWDLCRHQRQELFLEELISEEEYAAFAQDHAVVERLETYDALKARVEELERAMGRIRNIKAVIPFDAAYAATECIRIAGEALKP